MRNIFSKFIKKQSQQVLKNRQILLNRQRDQLKHLQPLKKKVKDQLLGKNIQQLLKINSEEVFNTFACRLLNPKIKQLNSLADVNIQRALKKNPKGIPFTVKDHLKVEGMIQSCGFSKNIKASTQSSQVVQILQKQGCIAYAHTNVPQGLLGIQSSNKVYGHCKNPFNPRYIAGGSTGGQGVQVATKASAFGLCSDSAGSVRIPAAFCGLYGFKPTGSKRLSVKGRVGVTGKQGPMVPGLDTSLGFITRNMDDMAWLCSKTLGKTLNQNPLVFNQWKQQIYQKSKKQKFTFGLITQSPQIQLAPSVKNVILQTAQLLSKQGHNIVQFKFPYLYKFRNFFFKVLNNTGFFNAMKDRIEGEYVMSQNQIMLNKFNHTILGRKLNVILAQSQLQRQKFQLYDIGKSTAQLLGLLKQKDFWQQQYNKQMNNKNIDLILSPTMPFPAPYHEKSKQNIHQLIFTAFQNVMQLPAGHVPIRLVKQNQTQYEDKRLYGAEVRRSIQKSEGLPVGVQITGKFMKDQVCLGAMWQINQNIKNKINLPEFD